MIGSIISISCKQLRDDIRFVTLLLRLPYVFQDVLVFYSRPFPNISVSVPKSGVILKSLNRHWIYGLVIPIHTYFKDRMSHRLIHMCVVTPISSFCLTTHFVTLYL